MVCWYMTQTDVSVVGVEVDEGAVIEVREIHEYKRTGSSYSGRHDERFHSEREVSSETVYDRHELSQVTTPDGRTQTIDDLTELDDPGNVCLGKAENTDDIHMDYDDGRYIIEVDGCRLIYE